MRIFDYKLCVLLLLVGCGRFDERPTFSRGEGYANAEQSEGEFETESEESLDSENGNTNSAGKNGQTQSQTSPNGNSGPTAPPVVATAKLKHADDLELLNSWKPGIYEGNDVFRLSLVSFLPFNN